MLKWASFWGPFLFGVVAHRVERQVRNLQVASSRLAGSIKSQAVSCQPCAGRGKVPAQDDPPIQVPHKRDSLTLLIHKFFVRQPEAAQHLISLNLMEQSQSEVHGLNLRAMVKLIGLELSPL